MIKAIFPGQPWVDRDESGNLIDMDSKIQFLTRDFPTAYKAIYQLIDYITSYCRPEAIYYLCRTLERESIDNELLNNLFESLPNLPNVIIAGSGLTLEQIRSKASSGSIGAKFIIDALVSQAESINAQWLSDPMMQHNVEWQKLRGSFSKLP